MPLLLKSGSRLIQSGQSLLKHFTNNMIKSSASPTKAQTIKGGKSYTVKTTDITNKIYLCELEADNSLPNSGQRKKPLVLLFAWLYSNPAHVSKYCQLYHDIGLDVLCLKADLPRFLWPPSTREFDKDLIYYLRDGRPENEPMFIHAFSSGAHSYALTMQEAAVNYGGTFDFRHRVIGQIFDSPVIGSWDNMSIGISQTLPENKLYRKFYLQALDVFYAFTNQSGTAVYERVARPFQEKLLSVPTLFYYSYNDPVCDTPTLEALVEGWKTEVPVRDVTSVSWRESVHVCHLKVHHDEYMDVWKQFMRKLQII